MSGMELGRIDIELFEDVPKTAYNFKCLCTGEQGEKLTFKNHKVHKIEKG